MDIFSIIIDTIVSEVNDDIIKLGKASLNDILEKQRTRLLIHLDTNMIMGAITKGDFMDFVANYKVKENDHIRIYIVKVITDFINGIQF